MTFLVKKIIWFKSPWFKSANPESDALLSVTGDQQVDIYSDW